MLKLKKITAHIMIVLMLLSGISSGLIALGGVMPGMSLPAYADETTQYNLWVGGVQVSSDNLTIDSSDSESISGSAVYNPSNKTLTLNNFSYTGPGKNDKYANGGIDWRIDDDLTIVLIGENSITKKDDNTISNSHGIYFNTASNNNTLTIKGAGSLNISFDENRQGYKSNGIFCEWGRFVMESGNVVSFGGRGDESAGIYASGDITFNGGTFRGEGYYSTKFASRGIYSSTITVNGGTVIGKVPLDNEYDARGFDNFNVTINDGDVTAIGKVAFKLNSGVKPGKGNSLTIQAGENEETATISEKVPSNAKYVHITSNPILPDVVKGPTANDLAYTGSEQELITEGTASGGTLKYAVTEDETMPGAEAFSTDIPKAVNAGLYYVWWMVQGDNEHADIKPSPERMLTCTISKKEKEGTDDQSGDRINQMGEDGTALGRGASFEAAERAILGMTSDSDPAGSKINPLKLRSKKQTKNSIKLTWTGAGGATKYVIYGNKCNSKGVRYKMTKLAETSKKTYNVKKIAGKKLGKGKYHKFIVVAVDGNNNVISTSKVIHVTTKGGKAGNYTRVSVSKNAVKKAKKLKAGKTLKLKGKAVGKRVKKHVKVRYESTNPNVATVTSGGKVKAVSKGKANITVYAQNGVYKNVKVVVK